MKILVLSDSHGRSDGVAMVLDRLAPMLDMIIHLGDNTSDMNKLMKEYKNLEIRAVLGNCDYSADYSREDIFTAAGKKIFITHGHYYGVKLSPQRIVYAAIEREADICLYGHTHIPVLFKEKTSFMNPGSISFPRDGGLPSYGIIAIENGESYMSVVSIQKDCMEVRYSMTL